MKCQHTFKKSILKKKMKNKNLSGSTVPYNETDVLRMSQIFYIPQCIDPQPPVTLGRGQRL